MTGTISSRTPEGQPNRCPVCEASIRIEPSGLTGDAPCPRCGHLLWFLHLQDWLFLVPADEMTPAKRRRVEKILDRVCDNLGVNKELVSTHSSFVEDIGADSLDLVELVMELEEMLDSPDEEDPDVL